MPAPKDIATNAEAAERWRSWLGSGQGDRAELLAQIQVRINPDGDRRNCLPRYTTCVVVHRCSCNATIDIARSFCSGEPSSSQCLTSLLFQRTPLHVLRVSLGCPASVDHASRGTTGSASRAGIRYTGKWSAHRHRPCFAICTSQGSECIRVASHVCTADSTLPLQQHFSVRRVPGSAHDGC